MTKLIAHLNKTRTILKKNITKGKLTIQCHIHINWDIIEINQGWGTRKKMLLILKGKISIDFNLEIIQMLDSPYKDFKAASIYLCIQCEEGETLITHKCQEISAQKSKRIKQKW